MAFKRYIHKHGKKLGPYYYENVRSHDGKVKTIYLGTNPSHHTHHKIRKPLFFLILVLILILLLGGSLFLLQNKSYLIKKARQHEPDFDIDQIFLKALVRSGEFLERQARVMNTGSDLVTINIEAFGLIDLVKIDYPSFTIKPGQTKIVGLNFSSVIPEQKIEQQPGVYVGKLIVKSAYAVKEIPIVVEIETKNVLFDMNLNPVGIDRKIQQGSDTAIEVRLFNLESIESANVDVEYFVKDMNGNTIISEIETVVVKTQASFFKTISIPKNLKPGPYVFIGQVRFGNSVGTSSYLFEVVGPETEDSFVKFCINSILCAGLSITTLLLLFALMAYFYFFIGAYLYEKVTGAVLIPKKKEKTAEDKYVRKKIDEEPKTEEPSRLILGIHSLRDKIRRKRKEWKILHERKKAEQERARKEELKKQEEVRRQEELLRQKEKLEKKRREEEIAKQKELEKQRLEEEKIRKQAEIEKQKELELKRKKEEIRIRKIQRKSLSSRRKKKIKEFFHNIGLYKTPEEKRQMALQKENEAREREKERQERLGREQELKRGKEIEAKQREELRQKQQLEEKRQKQEELRKKEELQKQKELVKKRAEAEKKRLEEQKRKEEELSRKRDKELKAKKLENVKEIEAKLSINQKSYESVQQKLKNLHSEKNSLVNNFNELNKKIEHLEHEIINKTGNMKELAGQKVILSEKFKKEYDELIKKQKEQAGSLQGRKKELAEKLASKQEQLYKELEEEFGKLSPEQRKSTEKWKRLEIKAKLKIEEQKLEDELKEYESAISKKDEEMEDEHKKIIENVNQKQKDLKAELADLENRKSQLLTEKKNIEAELAKKENEIKSISLKFENIKTNLSRLNSELANAKLETSASQWNIFGGLLAAWNNKKAKDEVVIPKKSKKLQEFYKYLDKINESIGKNDLLNAKKSYAEAREIYVKLDYEEKKEVYSELRKVYNKLAK